MSIPGLTSTFANPNPKILNPISISTSINNFHKFNGGIKFRVCAKTKDCEVSEPNARVYGQFSAPVKPSGSNSKKQKKENEEDKQDYYLNMGYAIRSLREEFPELFFRELTFDIYRDDIVFRDPLNTFAGIENYKSIFWALRFHGRIFFKALWVEILSVWQPVDNIILVRWTVHGIPRVPWESRGRFDGLSEYKLDKNGKIYEHKVDNIALNSLRKFHILSVEELIQSLGGASTPKPTCFEFSTSFSKFVPFMTKMKSVRHSLDSPLDFSLRHKAEASENS